MSKIKNGGLDQYGAGLFVQQQFGTAGIEGVKRFRWKEPLEKNWSNKVYEVPNSLVRAVAKVAKSGHVTHVLKSLLKLTNRLINS